MLPSAMPEALIVFTTFPDLDTARQIGTKLVEEQVAACVNLLGPAESILPMAGIARNCGGNPRSYQDDPDGLTQTGGNLAAAASV